MSGNAFVIMKSEEHQQLVLAKEELDRQKEYFDRKIKAAALGSLGIVVAAFGLVCSIIGGLLAGRVIFNLSDKARLIVGVSLIPVGALIILLGLIWMGFLNYCRCCFLM